MRKSNKKQRNIGILVVIGIILLVIFQGGFKFPLSVSRPCEDFGKCVGNNLYYCVADDKVGVTIFDGNPPSTTDAYSTWFCPNYGDRTEEGIKICDDNKCVADPLGGSDVACIDSDQGRDLKNKGEVDVYLNGVKSVDGIYEDRC